MDKCRSVTPILVDEASVLDPCVFYEALLSTTWAVKKKLPTGKLLKQTRRPTSTLSYLPIIYEKKVGK